MTDAGKEPGNTEHQVFISYASDNISSTTSDRQVADRICIALESQGIRCWIAPRDILPGNDWMDAIIDAVDHTKIIVLVFSANTEKSQWVKDEIKLALEEKRTIIPFRIQDVSPQRALKLLKVRCQWMDAFTPPLEKHIESLVNIVSRHLGLEPTIPVKKEKIKEKPGADQVQPAASEIKPVKGDKKETPYMPPEDVKNMISNMLSKHHLRLQVPEMPEDVKKMISKAHKIEKNKNGFWEAYYQDGIVMVYIPPGEFMMGQTDEEKKWLIGQIGEKNYNSYYANEAPLHKVYLDGYWIGKYEVTFAQYDRYCSDIKKEKPGDEGWGRENRPVINVSWTEAAAYCQWLSRQTGLEFKLPTEAQREKAARGNDQRKYPWGSREPGKDLANFSGNVGKATPVGSYPAGASPYGLLDMAGNVWEWCGDWYEAGYYKNSPQKNPAGPGAGSYRVFRGGGWSSFASYLLRLSQLQRALQSQQRFGLPPPPGYYVTLFPFTLLPFGRAAPFPSCPFPPGIYSKKFLKKWGTKSGNTNPLLTRILKDEFFLVLFLLNFYLFPAGKSAKESLYIQVPDPIYSKESVVSV
jgi:formylglycine-generating enzyme required for sulfatase activity